MYQACKDGNWGLRVWLPFYADTKQEVKEKMKEYGEDIKDVKYEEVPFPIVSR